MQIVRQGEIGKAFVINLGVTSAPFDLTGATINKLRFIEPDGVTVHEFVSGFSVLGSPTNGQIAYTDVAGIFPNASDLGYWKIIAHVTKSGTAHQSYIAGLFLVIGANE